MKVLQIVKTNRGATWAFNQANWLFKNDVDIVTVLPDNNSGYANLYKSNGMRVIASDWSLPIKQPWLFIKRVKEIKRIILQEKPDIIHLHFVTNVIMTRLALHNDKTIRLFQVPGPLHLENSLFRILDKALSTNVDYWAGACEKTCEIYRDMGINENKIFLAYYGTFKDEFCSFQNNNILHNEFGINKQSIIVSMISYFYKPKRFLGQKRGLKGHEDFIDAMEIVINKHPNVIPMVIGNAWDGSEDYEKEVIKYADKKLKGKMIFTGYRNDVQKIYPEINIAVHPSHSENLGGAAESLAYGVPTITTNVGGFPDIIKNYKTGLLCNAKKPKELADAIIWMIEHPYEAKQMGQEGEKLVRSLLNINSTSNQILNIYKRIIKI